MGIFKVWHVFILPAIANYYQVFILKEGQFDLVLVIVALVCSFVGSSVQVAEKNHKKKPISKSEAILIYAAGFLIAIMGYGLGVYTNKLFLTALFSAFVSYMSIEFLNGLKRATNRIINFMPEIVRDYLQNKYGNNDKEDDER